MNGQDIPIRTKRKLSLLVVDDEPNVCECLKLILALDGHQVVVANSGSAGLELFEANKFDVICTDYSMPSMRGDQFAAAIKAISPAQPVLMITGLAGTMTKPTAVDVLLGKPFVPNDLRRAFTELLDEAEASEHPARPTTDECVTRVYAD
jgi:CheY-like chemotaxis protein